MATEFTLRKISKLVSKIDRRIGQLTGEVNDNVTVPVVIHDEVDVMLTKVADVHTEWDKNFETLQKLIDARVVLRGALGSANQTAGINRSVTELRGLEQKLSIVTQLLRDVESETQLDSIVLERRIVARREGAKSTTIDVGGYGGFGRRGRETSSDSLNIPVLTDQDVGELKAQQRVFQDAIETTHDNLEQLNSGVGIELPDDLVQSLQTLEILGL